MGIDTPINPDPETTPESTPDVTSATGEVTPAVDSTSETPMADAGFAAEESPLAAGAEPVAGDEFAMEPQPMASDIAPVDDGELPPVAKKSNIRVIAMAAVFLLAVAIFAAVYFMGLIPGTQPEAPDVATNPMQPQTTMPSQTTTQPTTPPSAQPPVTQAPVTPPSAAAQPVPTPKPAAVPPPPPDPLPMPGPPPYAAPIQVSAPTPEPFNGGPLPPRIERMRFKHLTPEKLAETFRATNVDVSLDRGATPNEVLVTGYASQLAKARSVLKTFDVPEPPRLVVASLPPMNPTPTRQFRREGTYTVVPIEPPPGRHAGWIYNNSNGQIVAIFEDRSGVAHTVQVGDQVDGMQVIAITPETLTLRDKRGTEFRLKLQGLDTYQTRPSVNAAPAYGTTPGMPAWGNK